MPLHPIENTKNDLDSYARIECKIAVDFTEEIEAEQMDRLERSIHFEVGMMVSYMLGQFKMEMNREGSSGVCEIRTRALMPAAAIADYYRGLADDFDEVAECAGDSEDGESAEQQPRVVRGESPVSMAADWTAVDKLIEEIQFETAAKNASMPHVMKPPTDTTTTCGNGLTTTTATTTDPFVYECGLQTGDIVTYFNGSAVVDRSVCSEPVSSRPWCVWVGPPESCSEISVFGITKATRKGRELTIAEADGKKKFLDIEPQRPSEGYSSECQAYVEKHSATPFVYPCGLMAGDALTILDPFGRESKAVVAKRYFPPADDGMVEADEFMMTRVHCSLIKEATRGGVPLVRTQDGDVVKFREPCRYPCGLMEGDEVRDSKKAVPWFVRKRECEPHQLHPFSFIAYCDFIGEATLNTQDIATAFRGGKQLTRNTTPDGIVFSEEPITGS